MKAFLKRFAQKMTSRKFWVAVASIVTGLILLFGGDEVIAEQISGAVLVFGGAVGYMIAEGIVDSVHASEALAAAITMIEDIGKLANGGSGDE